MSLLRKVLTIYAWVAISASIATVGVILRRELKRNKPNKPSNERLYLQLLTDLEGLNRPPVSRLRLVNPDAWQSHNPLHNLPRGVNLADEI